MKQISQIIGHWYPAFFCAVISYPALFASGSSDTGWWKGPLLSFLPMCFFFVGLETWRMQKEIRELQKLVATSRDKQVSSHAAV